MVGITKRAFQLAQSCSKIDQIRANLVREGHSNIDSHLSSPSLRRELNAIMRARK